MIRSGVFPAPPSFRLKKTSAYGRAAMRVLALLAMLGPAAAQTTDLFNNTNTATVTSSPTGLTTFTLSAGALVTELVTYHWNNGRGAVPGTIGLRAAGGTVFGPFPAVGSPGQGGAPNVNWTATANFTLPAGDYTVIDSQPATWSQNVQSGHHGFAIVRGPTQGGQEQTPAKNFEYAVKFVCGSPQVPVVAPGEYFTAINVHNPSYRPVTFVKKVAVALPGEKPGPISKFFEAQLKPDQALEIDCPDILRHAEARGFLKGFVVIETDSELDVVAVYTAGHPLVETMRLERVQPRPIAKIVPPPPPPGAPAYCPAGGPGAQVGELNCCCNQPKYGPNGLPDGTSWPACRPIYNCVVEPTQRIFATCNSGGPVEIHSSQPAYCGQPH